MFKLTCSFINYVATNIKTLKSFVYVLLIDGIKLKCDIRKLRGKSPNVWKLSYTNPYSPWVKEEIKHK